MVTGLDSVGRFGVQVSFPEEDYLAYLVRFNSRLEWNGWEDDGQMDYGCVEPGGEFSYMCNVEGSELKVTLELSYREGYSSKGGVMWCRFENLRVEEGEEQWNDEVRSALVANSGEVRVVSLYASESGFDPKDQWLWLWEDLEEEELKYGGKKYWSGDRRENLLEMANKFREILLRGEYAAAAFVNGNFSHWDVSRRK